MDERTICYTEGSSCIRQVFAQVVIEEAKHDDETVEQYPSEEEEAFSPFVDHPEVKFLSESLRLSLGL